MFDVEDERGGAAGEGTGADYFDVGEVFHEGGADEGFVGAALGAEEEGDQAVLADFYHV